MRLSLHRNRHPILLALPLLVAAISWPAGPAMAVPAQSGDPAIEAKARRFIEEGSPEEAISILRGSADTTERALLLARAYLDDGNDFWAMRVLFELAESGEDCQPILWLAYTHIRQGALDEAVDLLEEAGCPDGSPLEVRRRLLETLLARTSGDDEQAAEALAAASKGKTAFAEDLDAYRALRASIQENYVRPISGRLELHSGWTSNALAGSPVDPAVAGSTPSSPLLHLSGNTRVIYPTGHRMRPVLDAEMRGLGIGAEGGRGLSYLQLSARPGILFGPGGRILGGYRLDTLGILGGDQYDDGPLVFYMAHRGELEAELLPWLTAFGGVGYRSFREARRSRLEVDGGLGAAWRPITGLNILGAFMGRYQSAAREDYDLFGVTALVQAEQRLPLNLGARVGLMASFDDYPRSVGYFGTELARRDLLAKLTAGLWSARSRTGLRGGLTYELSRKISTSPEYEYLDHRLLVRGQWAFSVDPRDPRPSRPPGHVPLSWGFEREEGGLEDSIQDLLRQDEAVRAGSSCVE